MADARPPPGGEGCRRNRWCDPGPSLSQRPALLTLPASCKKVCPDWASDLGVGGNREPDPPRSVAQIYVCVIPVLLLLRLTSLLHRQGTSSFRPETCSSSTARRVEGVGKKLGVSDRNYRLYKSQRSGFSLFGEVRDLFKTYYLRRSVERYG